jgi:hypothetical protein
MKWFWISKFWMDLRIGSTLGGPPRFRPRVKARRQPFMATALLRSKLQAFGLSLNRLDRGPKPGGSFLQGGRCRRHLNQLPIFCIGKARALTRHLFCSPRLQPPVLQGDGRIRKTNSPPRGASVDALPATAAAPQPRARNSHRRRYVAALPAYLFPLRLRLLFGRFDLSSLVLQTPSDHHLFQ